MASHKFQSLLTATKPCLLSKIYSHFSTDRILKPHFPKFYLIKYTPYNTRVKNDLFKKTFSTSVVYVLPWDPRSSGMLCSVDWYSVADVSGQPIGPILKGQAAHFGLPDPWRWARYVVPKRRRITFNTSYVTSQKAYVSFTQRWKPEITYALPLSRRSQIFVLVMIGTPWFKSHNHIRCAAWLMKFCLCNSKLRDAVRFSLYERSCN